MKRVMKHKLNRWLGVLLSVCVLVSCGMVRKGNGAGVSADAAMAIPADTLAPALQRKCDYFFLEAVRMKTLQKYDAAFDLLQHCLRIRPNAPSALFELSQYYMALKQEKQAVASLEKAVHYAPDNYWYAQGLVNLYQQQKETDKAVSLLEDMAVRFPDKLDPVYNLLDIYNRQQKYDRVLALLNRLEEKLGKSEQISMEKFRIYLQQEDRKNAFREMESLVAEYPNELRYQVVLGDVYLEMVRRRRPMHSIRRCWLKNQIMRWHSIPWLPITRRLGRRNSTTSSWTPSS